MTLSVVILAAGQGTRMKSALPKVLHDLGGQPLLSHVLKAAHEIGADNIYVVYGHGGEQLKRVIGDVGCRWVEQSQQLGTGHALNQALPLIDDDNKVLVLYGDVPLISADTLRSLLRQLDGSTLALLTAHLEDPTGYGRIVRDSKRNVCEIVEQKDASESVKRITEINTGFIAAFSKDLKRWLSQVTNRNSQGEYYLTDVIALAVKDGFRVHTVHPSDPIEIIGINTRSQLADMERHYQRRIAENLMVTGITLRDPSRIDVRGELIAAPDCVIDINAVFEGRVELGRNVVIGPNVCIKDSIIGENSQIFANSVIDGAIVGESARIGPFARLRPGTDLAADVHIGNFVELKKAHVQQGTKINHLSYVGDTRVGKEVNIGAGTITCNYDGANKHETIIGDRVFIGSDTQLVAPITIGNDATVAAGTTVTKDVPENVLVISRVPQQVKTGWRRPKK